MNLIPNHLESLNESLQETLQVWDDLRTQLGDRETECRELKDRINDAEASLEEIKQENNVSVSIYFQITNWWWIT